MVGGATSVGIGLVHITSATPWIPPTPMGNAWQIHMGRGYGFETLAVHQRHIILEDCPSYDPMALANEGGMVSKKAQDDFIKTHSAEVYKHTSAAQRQCLDIKPGLGGLIKAYLFKSK